jgi:hypothetical protein
VSKKDVANGEDTADDGDFKPVIHNA